MKTHRFMLKTETTQEETINTPGDLAEYLKKHGTEPQPGGRLMVAVRDKDNKICWLLPANFDMRFHVWNQRLNPVNELWKLLQNFLHIRTTELKERVYIAPEPDLGRTDGGDSYCSF